jgi:energy-coupling factor transporter ATP-binding protein EcfA2
MATNTKPATSSTQQPPYIKRVHLRNVPPLRDVKADFKPGLNIIIGKNGSGKTNFMKLVSELAEPETTKYKGLGCKISLIVYGLETEISFTERKPEKGNHHGPIPPRKSNANQALTVSASSKNQVVKDESLFLALANLLAKTDVGSQHWALGYNILTIWHGLPNHELTIIDSGTDLSFDDSGGMAITNGPDNAWQIGGVLERALIDSMVPYDVGSPANQFTRIDPTTIHRFITSRVNACLDRLNTYLPVYSPIQSVRVGEQFQVYSNSARDELIVKGLTLEYLIGGDWLPFSALSDGTKRIFYLIGELVTGSLFFGAGDNGFEELDEEKIIFLEEPELGIHPDQLQLLLQLIREVSQKHQVIMTTHSPQTLDMLSGQELDRITICEYIPGKGTQMRKLSAAKKAKAKAYLKDKGFLSEFWRFSNLEDPD